MDNLTPYINDTIANLSRKYDLRWRSHRVRVLLGVKAGDVPSAPPIFNLPTKWPFLICGLAFASDREDDRRIVSFTAGTSQTKFVADPTKLGVYGWPQSGQQGSRIPPAILTAEDRLEYTIIRDRTVDPLETYPGPKEFSTIDIVLIGAELMTKGSASDADK